MTTQTILRASASPAGWERLVDGALLSPALDVTTTRWLFHMSLGPLQLCNGFRCASWRSSVDHA